MGPSRDFVWLAHFTVFVNLLIMLGVLIWICRLATRYDKREKEAKEDRSKAKDVGIGDEREEERGRKGHKKRDRALKAE
jgi:hypothetical protein